MSDELTKLTVNLTHRSITALDDAAEETGDTRTDTVNRALQIYRATVGLLPGERITFDARDGGWVTLLRINTAHRAGQVAFVAVLIVLAFAAGVVSPW